MDTPHAATGEGRRGREIGLAAQVTLLWAGSRLWLALIYAGLRVLTRLPLLPAPAVVGEMWDIHHYLEIARQGYAYTPGSTAIQNVAFFPLWPMVLRLLGWIVGAGEPGNGGALGSAALPWAGSLAASLLFLAALLALARWMEGAASRRGESGDTGRRTILLTVTLLAFFPTSLYFSLPYTESLFLLLSVAAFLAWESGRWAGRRWRACCWG